MKYTPPIIVILVALFCFIQTGCTYHRWEGACRHKALYCALVVGEHHETRLAYGKTPKEEYHTQAQVYIAGEWEWLKKQGSS